MSGPHQQAFVSGAEGHKETAISPIGMDKCFLCSQQIGESDSRQFYTGPAGSVGVMMLAHTPCLNKFKAAGEVWPPPEQVVEPKPQVQPLGEIQRVVYGKARLAYDPRELTLLCNKEIVEHGLKAVIPDLIVALRAIEETL